MLTRHRFGLRIPPQVLVLAESRKSEKAMRTRFANGSISVTAWQVLCAVIFLGVMPHTLMAAPINLAFVKLSNCGTVTDQGPISASATNTGVVTTGTCANLGAEASGGASFVDGRISLSMTSIPGRGVAGQAYLDDYLTFHVAGGGSAVVDVSIAGGWGGTYNDSASASFQVEFDLGLGPRFLNGNGYSNLAYDDGLPASDAFVGTNLGGGVIIGSYLFNTTWTINDGVQYEFFAGLKAQASNGATAQINDPLIITLPAGVTYSSLSGRIYAPAVTEPSPIPEPSTLLLLCTGLADVARRRFTRS
jgi:hypothetical protein